MFFLVLTFRMPTVDVKMQVTLAGEFLFTKFTMVIGFMFTSDMTRKEDLVVSLEITLSATVIKFGHVRLMVT